MIVNFNEFLKESFSKEDGTLGEYISRLAETDDEVREIVASYTKEVSQSIDMPNAINVLSDEIKLSLLKTVEQHINGEEGELKVTANVNDESREGEPEEEPVESLDEAYGGKGIFTSFMKCLTALGHKDNTVSNDTPSNFLFIFRFAGNNGSDVKQVFNRFTSLKKVTIEEGSKISLYYGLRTDGMIEYGKYVDDTEPIGEFKMGKKIFKEYKTSSLKSLSGFKRLTVDLEHEDIVKFLKLKQVMSDFDPGHHDSKMPPVINGRVMTFAYYGYGSWSAGNFSPQDLEQIKNDTKEYLSKYRWTKDCQIAFDARNFWVYINIKLK